MSCNILDVKCVVVNELIGDAFLTLLIAGILFFIFMAKQRAGVKTTIWASTIFFPITSVLIMGSAGVSIAIVTIVAGIFLGLLHSRIIRNS